MNKVWKTPVEVNINEVPGRVQAGKYDSFVDDVIYRLEQTNKEHAILYEFLDEDTAKLYHKAVSSKLRKRLGKKTVRTALRVTRLYIWRGEKWGIA